MLPPGEILCQLSDFSWHFLSSYPVSFLRHNSEINVTLQAWKKKISVAIFVSIFMWRKAENSQLLQVNLCLCKIYGSMQTKTKENKLMANWKPKRLIASSEWKLWEGKLILNIEFFKFLCSVKQQRNVQSWKQHYEVTFYNWVEKPVLSILQGIISYWMK